MGIAVRWVEKPLAPAWNPIPHHIKLEELHTSRDKSSAEDRQVREASTGCPDLECQGGVLAARTAACATLKPWSRDDRSHMATHRQGQLLSVLSVI